MNFNLIPDNSMRRDLLILFDENARQNYALWKELGMQVRKEKNLEEIFRLLTARRKTWRKLAQYLIHPYEHRLPEELCEREEDLIVIEDHVDRYYSVEIGLTKIDRNDAATPTTVIF